MGTDVDESSRTKGPDETEGEGDMLKPRGRNEPFRPREENWAQETAFERGPVFHRQPQMALSDLRPEPSLTKLQGVSDGRGREPRVGTASSLSRTH